MSNVSAVTNHFPTANEGFITTLGGSILASAATVPLTSVSGLTNGTIFVGIIEPGQAKQQTFTGVVDTAGVQITGVKWTRGTDVDHTAGVTIVDYVSGTGNNMITKGILKHANQDGTLINGAISTTAQIGSGVVEQTNLREKASEYQADFVASGGVVAQSAGLVGTFSNIVYYISGVRYTATSIANKTYTASKDTYVDINGAGTVTYVEVANGAASPALTASSIRIAKVVTSGAAITSVTQNGDDSLGNKIYNLAPDMKRAISLLGRQGGSSTNWQTAGTTNYDPRGTGVFMQCGTIAVNADPTTVTFPVPFSAPPIVVCMQSQVSGANVFFRSASSITSTGFGISAVTDAGAINTAQTANWIAIGV